MIRSALIALGLSASGLGAGAAQAQGVVNNAPLLAICGGARSVLHATVEPDGAELMRAEDGEDEGAAAENADGRAAAPCDCDAPLAVGAKFTTDETLLRAAVLQGGVLPFGLTVTAQERIDGSDPSADFCP